MKRLAIATLLLLSGWVLARADRKLTTAVYQPLAQQTGNPLAQKVFKIFQENCAECHDDQGEDKDKFWINYQAMIKDQNVIPGKPDDSPVYTAVKSEKMPRDAPALSADQIAAIKEWITAGAPDWSLKNDQAPGKTHEPCPSVKAVKKAVGRMKANR